MHNIALTVILNGPLFFKFRNCSIFVSSPPPPQPVWMCARFCNAISLFNHGGRSTKHKRFLDENLQFKAGFKWLLKEFLVIKDNKEIFDTLHTAAYGADGKFFGRWLSWRTLKNWTQLRLTPAVYYSDFAQQIIENAAVSDWNYNLIHFEISSSRYFTR